MVLGGRYWIVGGGWRWVVMVSCANEWWLWRVLVVGNGDGCAEWWCSVVVVAVAVLGDGRVW